MSGPASLAALHAAAHDELAEIRTLAAATGLTEAEVRRLYFSREAAAAHGASPHESPHGGDGEAGQGAGHRKSPGVFSAKAERVP